MARRGVRAWSRRWVQNPVVTLFLGGALVASASNVYNAYTVATRFGRVKRTGGAGHPIWIVRQGEGFAIRDPDNESWDEMTKVIRDRPQDAIQLRYSRPDPPVYEGFYAPTRAVYTWRVSVTPVRGESLDLVPPPNGGEARAAFVRWWAQQEDGPPPDVVNRLLAEDFTRTEVRWSGYVHDAAALGAFVLFLYSLAWIPRAPSYLARTRAQRRLARGRCPHCEYSIEGLPEPVCPECGGGWNITAEDDLPPGSGGGR